MSLVICDATLIDGVAQRPLEGQSIWIEGNRIRAIGRREDIGAPAGARVIPAPGKYVIPGLMDANVHLLLDVRLETLVRHEGRYPELIVEAAQVALRNGITTVFDTWGPRAALIEARDRIAAGERPGSRIFCAGNIVGLDGPLSENFMTGAAAVASPALVKAINAMWAENVGPALTWMTPDDVAREIRIYLARGIDFIKYAASEHTVGMGPTALLAFSSHVQKALVDEVHRAGLTVQAHTQSIEALRGAIEAGCDIIQHANITGPAAIPASTLELMARKGTAATVFPLTKRRYDWVLENDNPFARRLWTREAVETNVQSLIRAGVTLLLATDGGVLCGAGADPTLGAGASGEDNLFELGQGHFFWLEAMEEHGFAPFEALRAATRNIAEAYGKGEDLGTLEIGKIADLVILDANPLLAARNYRSIHMVIKDGVVVDRAALPQTPILTRSLEQPGAASGSRREQLRGLPSCCLVL